jgi:hypothetical protein
MSVTLDELLERKAQQDKPVVTCLCGSTRFSEAFQTATLQETIAGKIVLSIGCNTKCDTDLIALGQLTQEAKDRLDILHYWKIDLADEVLILNVGGYTGDSTKREIEYARRTGKRVRWLEEFVRVALINPTEEACTNFENAVLAGIHYRSDVDDNSFDVIYTIPADVSGVQEWADTARANGSIENIEMLGE